MLLLVGVVARTVAAARSETESLWSYLRWRDNRVRLSTNHRMTHTQLQSVSLKCLSLLPSMVLSGYKIPHRLRLIISHCCVLFMSFSEKVPSLLFLILFHIAICYQRKYLFSLFSHFVDSLVVSQVVSTFTHVCSFCHLFFSSDAWLLAFL